ncbi:MAG TPA: SOS response-associated peptidase [Candidatus Baltobacteraceae bacterium]|nr:SOS response-associated peptidase [Candidatus Baltobacteraceae bacterium]
MCARYSLTKDQITMLIGEIEVIINIAARYNIAPTQIVPTIVRAAKGIETVSMKWGFKSAWSSQPLINAKAETISSTSFKQHLHHRCLIPADGFYEWTADKTPIRFTLPHDEPFCFAGLWQEETKHEIDLDTKEHRCVILTTTPNETVARVHNRMPLIVHPNHYDWWLKDGGLFETVLKNPYRPALEWCPVNRALNSVRNEGAKLIRPTPIQKDLI